jgi:hypothetical protein
MTAVRLLDASDDFSEARVVCELDKRLVQALALIEGQTMKSRQTG